DTLKFYWWGSYIPIVAPAIKDTKVVKVQLYLGQYSNQSSYWLNLISLMFFKRVRFVKNNTTFWHDNPNRYPAGSEEFIDGT
ncbi:hypothetical protein ACP3WD_24730, partial [Salmonella enterica]|uniref:hypothetical protein n=1 Tax=Salmonella enterica TaxID=28901 RepID=UPI003CEBE99E